jgi:mono/diheme cytochrome c family protein
MKLIEKQWLFILPAAVVFALLASANYVSSSIADAHSIAGDAATTYVRQCSSCHGRDGRGRTRKGRQTHARDLTDGAWQDDVSDERLFNSINNGRGKKMPAFKKSLPENEIDALVGYVRRLRR